MAESGQGVDGRTTILVVDDDQAIRSMLSFLLTNLGYSAVEAGDGVEALAVVEQNSVTAILMDVLMPRMDGFEVCRRVKADPATAHIPVVLVTGSTGHKDRRQGMEAGADEFVSKPVHVAELLSVLDRVLPDGWRD